MFSKDPVVRAAEVLLILIILLSLPKLVMT